MLNEYMPVLEMTRRHFSRVDFSKSLIVSCQHILPTNIPLYEGLIEQGLAHENCFILGKCYSTNKSAYETLVKLGFQVSLLSSKFLSHQPFDSQYGDYVEEFLENILKNKDFSKFEKVIIIDDGGALLKNINHKFESGIIDDKNLVGLEQTSSGYNRLYNENIHFPIINVARSFVKLQYESINVAELAYEKIVDILKEFKKVHSILIIGGGYIGSSIKTHFIGRHPTVDISIYDIDDSKTDILDKDLVKIIGNYDMIIGCSGESAFSEQYFSLLKKDTILVSNSSSDREFAATNLRRKVTEYNDPHRNIEVDNVILFSSGFPITFYGGDGFKPEYAQLTRSLMFAGICQANIYLGDSRGFVDLDHNIQNNILSRYKNTSQF